MPTPKTRTPLEVAVNEVERQPYMNGGLRMMVTKRKEDFPTLMAAKLAGIAATPKAREYVDDKLDEWWAAAGLPETGPARSLASARAYGPDIINVDEVVIGAGLHAAIYCATRVANGFPRPLVLEQLPRAGGAFAVSKGPSFYLNSRNRPGPLGLPGSGDALNVIPNAVIQPSMLSADEYQRNDDMAFAIRTTLAHCANVVTGAEVVGVAFKRVGTVDLAVRPRQRNQRNRTIRCKRLIIASGLGRPKLIDRCDGKKVIDFMSLMAAMDQPFPLRGMQRVAVIGGGDSGRAAIEALFGQGPSRHSSVAHLDWVGRVDWYTRRNDALRADYISSSRSRYARIGCFLGDGAAPARLRIRREQERQITTSASMAWVNERPYDKVVICLGFDVGLRRFVDIATFAPVSVGGRSVGLQYAGAYVVGPAANIEVSDAEVNSTPVFTRVENTVALWRYAERTAALATSLPKT